MILAVATPAHLCKHRQTVQSPNGLPRCMKFSSVNLQIKLKIHFTAIIISFAIINLDPSVYVLKYGTEMKCKFWLGSTLQKTTSLIKYILRGV